MAVTRLPPGTEHPVANLATHFLEHHWDFPGIGTWYIRPSPNPHCMSQTTSIWGKTVWWESQYHLLILELEHLKQRCTIPHINHGILPDLPYHLHLKPSNSHVTYSTITPSPSTSRRKGQKYSLVTSPIVKTTILRCFFWSTPSFLPRNSVESCLLSRNKRLMKLKAGCLFTYVLEVLFCIFFHFRWKVIPTAAGPGTALALLSSNTEGTDK